MTSSKKGQRWRSTESNETALSIRLARSAGMFETSEEYHSLVRNVVSTNLTQIDHRSAALFVGIGMEVRQLNPHQASDENVTSRVWSFRNVFPVAIARSFTIKGGPENARELITQRPLQSAVVLHDVVFLVDFDAWENRTSVLFIAYGSAAWEGAPTILTNDPTGFERCLGCVGCYRRAAYQHRHTARACVHTLTARPSRKTVMWLSSYVQNSSVVPRLELQEAPRVAAALSPENTWVWPLEAMPRP